MPRQGAPAGTSCLCRRTWARPWQARLRRGRPAGASGPGAAACGYLTVRCVLGIGAVRRQPAAGAVRSDFPQAYHADTVTTALAAQSATAAARVFYRAWHARRLAVVERIRQVAAGHRPVTGPPKGLLPGRTLDAQHGNCIKGHDAWIACANRVHDRRNGYLATSTTSTPSDVWGNIKTVELPTCAPTPSTKPTSRPRPASTRVGSTTTCVSPSCQHRPFPLTTTHSITETSLGRGNRGVDGPAAARLPLAVDIGDDAVSMQSFHRIGVRHGIARWQGVGTDDGDLDRQPDY